MARRAPGVSRRKEDFSDAGKAPTRSAPQVVPGRLLNFAWRKAVPYRGARHPAFVRQRSGGLRGSGLLCLCSRLASSRAIIRRRGRHHALNGRARPLTKSSAVSGRSEPGREDKECRKGCQNDNLCSRGVESQATQSVREIAGGG